jgi:hypothetical protein
MAGKFTVRASAPCVPFSFLSPRPLVYMRLHKGNEVEVVELVGRETAENSLRHYVCAHTAASRCHLTSLRISSHSNNFFECGRRRLSRSRNLHRSPWNSGQRHTMTRSIARFFPPKCAPHYHPQGNMAYN